MSKVFKFYKYQSLLEEKHFDYLENYLNQRVWFTPLEQFNDPFEGKCFSLPLSPKCISSNSDIFDYFFKQYQLNGWPELTANEFKKVLNSEECRNYSINNSRITSFKKHGALCLTRKNNNIPMWAYYADNHKGYCVEFELDFSCFFKKFHVYSDNLDYLMKSILAGRKVFSSKLRDHPQAFLFGKVQYKEQAPSVNFHDFLKLKTLESQFEYIFKNSVGVKFIDWQHEDEFRLVTNGNSEENGLFPLKPLAPYLKVTGIIIGKKMDDNKHARVQDLCLDKNIKTYRAILSNSDYEIIIEPCLNLNHTIS